MFKRYLFVFLSLATITLTSYSHQEFDFSKKAPLSFIIAPHSEDLILLTHITPPSKGWQYFCNIQPQHIIINQPQLQFQSPQFIVSSQNDHHHLHIKVLDSLAQYPNIYIRIANKTNTDQYVVVMCSLRLLNEDEYTSSSRALLHQEAPNKNTTVNYTLEEKVKQFLLYHRRNLDKAFHFVQANKGTKINLVAYKVLMDEYIDPSMKYLQRLEHYLINIERGNLAKIQVALEEYGSKLSTEFNSYRDVYSYLHQVEFMLMYIETYLLIDKNWVTFSIKNKYQIIDQMPEWGLKVYQILEDAVEYLQDQTVSAMEDLENVSRHDVYKPGAVADGALVRAYAKLQRYINVLYKNKTNIKKYLQQVLHDRLFDLHSRTVNARLTTHPREASIVPTHFEDFQQLCEHARSLYGEDGIIACELAYATEVDVYQTEVKIILTLLDYIDITQLNEDIKQLLRASVSLHPLLEKKLKGEIITDLGHPDLAGGFGAKNNTSAIDSNFFEALLQTSTSIQVPKNQWLRERVTLPVAPVEANAPWALALASRLKNPLWLMSVKEKAMMVKTRLPILGSVSLTNDNLTNTVSHKKKNKTSTSSGFQKLELETEPTKPRSQKDATEVKESIAVFQTKETEEDASMPMLESPSVKEVLPSNTPQAEVLVSPPAPMPVLESPSVKEVLPPNTTEAKVLVPLKISNEKVTTEGSSAEDDFTYKHGPVSGGIGKLSVTKQSNASESATAISTLKGQHRKTYETIDGRQAGVSWHSFKYLWKSIGGTMQKPGSGGSHRTLFYMGHYMDTIFKPHGKKKSVGFGKRQTSKLKKILNSLDNDNEH